MVWGGEGEVESAAESAAEEEQAVNGPRGDGAISGLGEMG